MERYRDRQTTGKNDGKKKTAAKNSQESDVWNLRDERMGRDEREKLSLTHSLALAGWSLVSNKEHQRRAQSTATRTGNSVIIR